jgi:drug/metabolite transporter (DMT)-like permease
MRESEVNSPEKEGAKLELRSGLAVLALILACALWGISFPLVKALHLEQTERIPESSSEFLTAWILVARFLLAAILLAPFVIRMGRPTRLEVKQGLLLSVFGGIGIALQVDGLAYTEASTSAFLTQAYCVVLPLWAAIQTRRRPTLRVAGATLLVLIGGGILAGVRPGHYAIGRGEAETLLAALFFALQILCLERKSFDANRGCPVTLVMCAGTALLFLPLAFLAAPSSTALIRAGESFPAQGIVVVLALFCTVGPFLLMNIWQRRIPATEAGLIYTTEPVFTAVYALVIPVILSGLAGVNYANERFTFPLVAGASLILLANILMQWRRSAHRPAVAPVP